MKKVLLVDDSQKMRGFVKEILSKNGYKMVTAHDAFTAFEILEENFFDLLILDINMPFKNGFALLESTRQLSKYKHTPVIFLTSRSSKRDIHKAISLGASGYVLKPVKAPELLEKVGQALGLIDEVIPMAEKEEFKDFKISMQLEGDLSTLDFDGVELRVPYDIPEGQIIFATCPLFSQIGIRPHSLLVVGSRKIEGGFIVRMKFQGLNWEGKQILKNWLTYGRFHRRIFVS